MKRNYIQPEAKIEPIVAKFVQMAGYSTEQNKPIVPPDPYDGSPKRLYR